MKMVFSNDHIKETVESLLLPLVSEAPIFLFYGPMGSGKTAVIKAFAESLGIKEVVVSPTFGYLHRYNFTIFNQDWQFYHFDLYRVPDCEEFIMMGFDELLGADRSVCCVEWPEVIDPLIAKKNTTNRIVSVRLKYVLNHPFNREVEISLGK